MSTSKIILGIVIIVLIIIGIGIWYGNGPVTAPSNQTGINNPNANQVVNGSSMENTTIDQDMASIDTDLNGLSDSTASADASLNDKPVQQDQI